MREGNLGVGFGRRLEMGHGAEENTDRVSADEEQTSDF